MQSDKKEEEQSTLQNVPKSDKPCRSEIDGWVFRRANRLDRSSHSFSSADVKIAKPSVTMKQEPVVPRVGRSRIPLDSETYDMEHKRRGVALIFNHINFKQLTPRKGAAKDCADLKATLEKLDFEVRIYTDLTLEKLSSVLTSTAAEDHTDADCLLVAVMSHGRSGAIHTVDALYPVDLLWQPFSGDRCYTLAGKPKLFFIQACRGTRMDQGIKIIHETDSRTSYYLPSYADIMIAYSAFEGHYSWRNPDMGSWFIQAVCEELNSQGRTRDLLTLMTFVNRRVAIEYQSFVPQDPDFHGKKQMPSVVSMLTRLVYFPEKRTTSQDDALQTVKFN